MQAYEARNMTIEILYELKSVLSSEHREGLDNYIRMSVDALIERGIDLVPLMTNLESDNTKELLITAMKIAGVYKMQDKLSVAFVKDDGIESGVGPNGELVVWNKTNPSDKKTF